MSEASIPRGSTRVMPWDCVIPRGSTRVMLWDEAIPRGSTRVMLWDEAIPRGRGAARSGKKEFVQFLRISLGSLSELETQFLISERLGYMEEEEPVVAQIKTVRKLLLGLIRHLKKETA
jgi:hypothetical protein